MRLETAAHLKRVDKIETHAMRRMQCVSTVISTTEYGKYLKTEEI